MDLDTSAHAVETAATDVQVQDETISQPDDTVGEAASKSRVNQYTDGYSYEVPRPFLTLEQAAAVLGKSMRALERSLLGRWGNKLPEGWVARKLRTELGDEWRILPPPGMRIKLAGTEYDTNANDDARGDAGAPGADSWIQAEPVARRRQIWRPEKHTLDQPAIVIDRSEEVEHLLRELYCVQRTLAEERRTHMEDLRMITQLQGSLRLLEVNAAEQSKTKTELEIAKHQLADLQKRYEEIAAAPWWKRPFMRLHRDVR